MVGKRADWSMRGPGTPKVETWADVKRAALYRCLRLRIQRMISPRTIMVVTPVTPPAIALVRLALEPLSGVELPDTQDYPSE